MIDIRTLTVEPFSCPETYRREYVQLRLKGKWLAEAGFEPGDKVLIVPVDGMLVIVKDDQAKGGD